MSAFEKHKFFDLEMKPLEIALKALKAGLCVDTDDFDLCVVIENHNADYDNYGYPKYIIVKKKYAELIAEALNDVSLMSSYDEDSISQMHEDGVEANFEIIYQRWYESNAAQYDQNSGFKSPQEFLMNMGVDEKEYYKYIPGDYVEAIKLLERAMKEISTD
ncbi:MULTISPECIES: hypothetical protein [Aeromonas]|uniref:hypothetical protein n=1 Tax=Aeromonas TaxID=642 RepID=UPI000DE588E9|nr:hypothetical protein [Aeromonas caviae]MDX7645879.1 hypothetical protein [Aeromonas caviae]